MWVVEGVKSSANPRNRYRHNNELVVTETLTLPPHAVLPADNRKAMAFSRGSPAGYTRNYQSQRTLLRWDDLWFEMVVPRF